MFDQWLLRETTIRTALEDSRLSAIVHHRVPLLYAEGADPGTDRPAHVRAASGLVRVNDRIALIQDDASFVALIDPASGHAQAIPLPTGEDGIRQFDRTRGNKKHKLDLEACVAVVLHGDPALLAFGSGSKPRREVVAVVRFRKRGPEVGVVALPAFYAALRREQAFAGSELNVEAAIVVDDTLRLFSRGNGKTIGELSAVNASCDVSLASFMAHLEAPDVVASPTPANIVGYDLGTLAGVKLGFTDATVVGEATYYSAAAEASPDAIEDGGVTGSAIGVIDRAGAARWCAVTETSGSPFTGKIEGILMASPGSVRLLAVIDMDDPGIPSELCTIELAGPWEWLAPRAGDPTDQTRRSASSRFSY